MMLLEGLRVAWLGVTAQKLRSLLTMLGIIIGVSAVIALVAVGEGATRDVQDRIQNLGSNLILVSPLRQLGGRLELEDIPLIKTVAYQVQAVVPSVTGSVSVRGQGESYSTTLEGTTPDFLPVRSYKMALGQFISEDHVTERSKVAVLGPTTAERLFGSAMPLGETVRIGTDQFLVIGVTESKGGSLGGDNDDRIWAPITTAQRVLNSRRVGQFAVQVGSPEDAPAATALLTDFYRLKLRRENAVRVLSMDQVLETVSSVSATMKLLLGAIASISLIVGGIGIMNIMLVSVSERTREIGIRKALGGKRRDILMQFLIESLILSLAGGLMGVALGIGSAQMVGRFSSIKATVSGASIIVSFAFAAAVGIFFGLYPAIRASQLDPIEALRRE